MAKRHCRTRECCQPQSAADEELARYAKALAHPVRVEILRILAAQTKCICGDMVALLPLAQSTVSQHLKVLKQAGLVQGEIDGPRVRYCVAPQALERFKTLVRQLGATPGPRPRRSR